MNYEMLVRVGYGRNQAKTKRWKIDGLKCDYIFWDRDMKHRIPTDRDFKPGEFEERYNP
ncbi:MAG: hypothetical protein HQK58_09365 [Deltaproteobacteria bacterium]|nr:hypothetical protein [Deltaproteobacteria bacterium]